MRVALLLGAAVVGDVDLAADDRLDPGSLGRLEELHRPRHRPVVGERDGRHLELGGPGDEVGNPAGAVEDRVLGVDVEVDERRFRHAEGQGTTRSRWPPSNGARSLRKTRGVGGDENLRLGERNARLRKAAGGCPGGVQRGMPSATSLERVAESATRRPEVMRTPPAPRAQSARPSGWPPNAPRPAGLLVDADAGRADVLRLVGRSGPAVVWCVVHEPDGRREGADRSRARAAVSGLRPRGVGRPPWTRRAAAGAAAALTGALREEHASSQATALGTGRRRPSVVFEPRRHARGTCGSCAASASESTSGSTGRFALVSLEIVCARSSLAGTRRSAKAANGRDSLAGTSRSLRKSPSAGRCTAPACDVGCGSHRVRSASKLMSPLRGRTRKAARPRAVGQWGRRMKAPPARCSFFS